MAAVNSARDCPICLEKFRDPVVTPCGHVGCSACMTTYARGSNNPYEATCPTCRAPFPIVTPDKSIIPKQYHVFISPPFRRVFLGDGPAAGASAAIEEDLRAEIAALNTRVAALSDERAARLTQNSVQDSAREEARLSNTTIRVGLLFFIHTFIFFFGPLPGYVYFYIFVLFFILF